MSDAPVVSEREVAAAKWQRSFETWCWIFGVAGGYYLAATAGFVPFMLVLIFIAVMSLRGAA